MDTTISGSGTLTPLSQDTLTAAGPVTLTGVNCAAGDTVGSGTVLATGEDAAGETVEYTAPYDCVVLEIPVAAGDELAAFTIDAVEDGEVTGAISQVSYNGSSNGSATAYQITAQIGYVEGVYGLFSGSAASLDWTTALAAVLFCAVIGVAFGGYPAAKASRLQPIEALQTL